MQWRTINKHLGELDYLDFYAGTITSWLCDHREITTLYCVAQFHQLQNEKNATCPKSLRDW